MEGLRESGVVLPRSPHLRIEMWVLDYSHEPMGEAGEFEKADREKLYSC